MEKKSERLEVRLGYEEKQAFTDACDTQGDTPSGAIRRFINGYVRRADSDVLSGAWRGAVKRKLPKLGLITAAAIIICASGWGIYKSATIVSDSEVFTFRDRNNDDMLTVEEFGYTGEDLLRVLDTDASGAVSREEFQAKGRMVYVLSGPKADEKMRHKPRHGESPTLVKFSLTQERTRSGTYRFDEIHLVNVDRVVFWHDGGGVSVLDGPVEIDLGSEVIEGVKP